MKQERTNLYQPKNITTRVKKHVKALGFRDVSAYLTWCENHGFPGRLKKNYQELEAEQYSFVNGQVVFKHHMKMHRNPDQFFQDICYGRILAKNVHRLDWADVAHVIESYGEYIREKENFVALLRILNRKTKFVFGTVRLGRYQFRYINAIVKLHQYRSYWVRDIKEWHPQTHNMQAQFESLLRHLFSHYDVPKFMDSAWFRRDKVSKQYRKAYIHIGKGQNVRIAEMPIMFTKKMAHFMLQAPDSCSVESAINWSCVRALGGSNQLCRAVLGSRIGENLEHQEFWMSVYRFFVENPSLETVHVAPIIDYLNAQKFEVHECAIAPGIVHRIPPLQPNLSMNGRTPATLLKQVGAWHKELGKSLEAQKYVFKPSGIPSYVELSDDGVAFWRIRELLSGAELVNEGRMMKHCIATYARDCDQGWASIWTLELISDASTKKRLTIEVCRWSDGSLEIYEVRGKNNRGPTKAEFRIIKKWAHAAELEINEYIDVDGEPWD